MPGQRSRPAKNSQLKKVEMENAKAQLQVNRARDIPSIPLQPINVRAFNFCFAEDVDNYYFSARDMCLMIGVCHPGAVVSDVYPAFQAVRIQKIELWSGSDPTPGSTVRGVQAWVGRTLTNGNPIRLLGNLKQDVAVPGTDVPAHVVLSPRQKANSILRQWFEQDDTSLLFGVTGGKNTIMQITVCYTLNLYPPTLANSIQTNSYLSVTGRPALGLSAIDTGNVTGSRLVRPIPMSASLAAQLPIFD